MKGFVCLKGIKMINFVLCTFRREAEYIEQSLLNVSNKTNFMHKVLKRKFNKN